MYTKRYFDQVLSSYIEAAYWTDTGEDGQPSSDIDLSPKALDDANKAVTKFLARMQRNGIDPSEVDPGATGHDIWLTRNRHGVGFWDRKEIDPAIRDVLTRLADELGETYLVEGDDGLGYFE